MTRTEETLVAGLHSAARHYCMVAHPTPTLPGIAAPDLAKRRFSWIARIARHAFLREIEHTTPQDFPDVGALRRFLHHVGETQRYVNPHDQIEPGARDLVSPIWAEERQRFLAYVDGLTDDELRHQRLLPYRHFLSSSLGKRIWSELGERWGINPRECWYPLRLESAPFPTLIVQDAWFLHEVGPTLVNAILRTHRVRRTFEVYEGRRQPEYELDPLLWDWVDPETYWTSRTVDWVIYHSHEGSLTFAGDSLIDAVKSGWPSWQRRVYTGWDYERPPAGEPPFRSVAGD